jgi:hypothetical protein
LTKFIDRLTSAFFELHVGRETEHSLKEQGARALWDNLDDIILLVVELQEVRNQCSGNRSRCSIMLEPGFALTLHLFVRIIIYVLRWVLPIE